MPNENTLYPRFLSLQQHAARRWRTSPQACFEVSQKDGQQCFVKLKMEVSD